MTDPFNLVDVPTVAQYRDALPKCVREARTWKETEGRSIIKEMLMAHYWAPERTLTAGELAEKVKLTNFGDVNLRYGKFGRLLCERLDRKPKLYVAMLVTFDGGRWDDGMIRWTMLPPVVAAIEELSWNRPSTLK